MNQFRILIFAALLVLGSVLSDSNIAIAQQAKISNYHKQGLKFQFPSNWQVTTDKFYTGTRLLIVKGPENAIVTIQLTESEVADDILDYSKDFSKTAAKASETVKLVDSSFGKLKKNKLGFQVIKEDFTIALKSEDELATNIAHQREFLVKTMGKYTCFIVCQVATDHLAEATEGFSQLTKTIQLESKGR